MNNTARDMIYHAEVPAHHLIDFNPRTNSFVFYLHPNANHFLTETLARNPSLIQSFGIDRRFAPFIQPKNDGWGLGETFFLDTSAGPIQKDWIAWRCPLPKPNDPTLLHNLSGGIYILTSALNIFEYDHSNDPIIIPQFLTIENMSIDLKKSLHGAAFGVICSKHTLDFYAKMQGYQALRNKIFQSMVGASSHMAKGNPYLPRDFMLSQNQGNPRLPYFKLPMGNCCCIGTDRPDPENGAEFSSHNVDTHYQRLVLLAGIATLANLARKHWFIKNNLKLDRK